MLTRLAAAALQSDGMSSEWCISPHTSFTKKPDEEDKVKGQQHSEAFNAQHQSHNTK